MSVLHTQLLQLTEEEHLDVLREVLELVPAESALRVIVRYLRDEGLGSDDLGVEE